MESKSAIEILAALAQETRLQAFKLLVRNEPKGLAAGELAKLLEVPQNTLSTHLSILQRASLLTNERNGRSIIYRARLDAMQDVVLYLLQDCCNGKPELCKPLVTAIAKSSSEKCC